MTHSSVAVVGLGRVGLTLALVLANSGFEVRGIDSDPEVVDLLTRGEPPFFEQGLRMLLRKQMGRNFTVARELSEATYPTFVLCLPTPVEAITRRPILAGLLRGAEELVPHLEDGCLVVLRSTVPVGATRNQLLPVLMKAAGRVRLAFCPERTAEGKAIEELHTLPQIIGGLDPESVELAVGLFSRVTATTIRMRSLEAAELVKLVDNTFRDVTFAYANEIALFAEGLGLDAFEVIRAANLGYPRNHIPAPGFVGGSCLGKDPYLLLASAGSSSVDSYPLVKHARDVNEWLPRHAAAKLSARLAQRGKRLAEAKVLVTGIAFKGRPATDDVRNSPALDLIQCLTEEHGCQRIWCHDFVVSAEAMGEAGLRPCALEEGFDGADAVVFANNHPSYLDLDMPALVRRLHRPAVIIDVWRLFDQGELSQPGIDYGGIGFD